MKKLEREGDLLALNGGQRLALLFALSNYLNTTGSMSLEAFEEMIAAYRPAEKERKGG